MDVDSTSLVHYSSSEHSANAEAGPSSQPEIPLVFLPPPAPPSRAPLFSSTQDLITRFQLLPVYDKYVRPSIRSALDGDSHSKTTLDGVPTPAPFQAPTPGGVDKGKGKEVLVGTPAQAATPAAGAAGDGDGDDEDGGDKKKKNNYKHLIKGIPGKHSMKKDEYLQTIMQVPPKQKMNIAKFDIRTQREAFSVSLEGLKGWNINALVAESAQAREDRKKRKERKRLAKAEMISAIAIAQPSGLSPIAPTSSAPVPITSLVQTARRSQTPISVGTPRPAPAPPQRGASRPPGTGPGPPAQARPGTPALQHTIPSTLPSRPAGTPMPPVAASVTADSFAIKRGKKREHEDGAAAAQKRPVVTAGITKAGAEGVRPRPTKKPRTDSNGHAPLGMVPQQQPTPQGV